MPYRGQECRVEQRSSLVPSPARNCQSPPWAQFAQCSPSRTIERRQVVTTGGGVNRAGQLTADPHAAGLSSPNVQPWESAGLIPER